MIIYCDGGSRGNPGPAASAFVVTEDGKTIFKDSKFLGVETNNVAEYSAVLLAMEWLRENKINQEVKFFLDSQLITNQLIGTYKIKDTKLAVLATKVKNIKRNFPQRITYINIPREQNKIADLLVNEVLDKKSRSEKSNIKSI